MSFRKAEGRENTSIVLYYKSPHVSGPHSSNPSWSRVNCAITLTLSNPSSRWVHKKGLAGLSWEF